MDNGGTWVWYVAGGILLAILAAAGSRAWAWMTGRESRQLDDQVRNAHRNGDFRLAGDLQARRGNYAEAARLYAQGKEWLRQARALEHAGELESAAEAFMQAGDYASAAKHFEALGDSTRAALCLQQSSSSPETQRSAAEHFEKSGQYLEAARLYQELGEFERAATLYAKVKELDPPDLVITMLETAALSVPEADPKRRDFLARAAAAAYKLGLHERAARAYDGAGDLKRAADLYERALRRFDLAAAAWTEAGDLKQVERLTELAGGQIEVLRARETRARERGDAPLAREIRDEIRKREVKHPSVPITREDERSAQTQALGVKPKPRNAKQSVSESGTRYEILSELGRGGMGVVYRARDQLLGRDVALKFLPDDDNDPTRSALFRREARAAAALSHPGIVTIFDVGKQDGREFIAMELVDGQPLDRLLEERGGKLSLLEGLEISEAVLSALSFAHEANVIHRDLKPSNLMKMRNGGIKIMDFGLAKKVGHTTGGQPTMIAGTPAYMPPEQMLGATDSRSDLFALGATLYELFTGQLPGFEHEPASSARGYPSPRDREGVIPEKLSALIMRCLTADPAKRPQTAKEVLAEVRTAKHAITDAFRMLDPALDSLPLPGDEAPPKSVTKELPKKLAGGQTYKITEQQVDVVYGNKKR